MDVFREPVRVLFDRKPIKAGPKRWGWVTFGGWLPPTYLALYDLNTMTPERLKANIEKVKRVIGKW